VKIRITGPDEALDRLRAGLSVVPEIDTRDIDAEAIHHRVISERRDEEPAS
jgi:membrane fusion protein (multidrug efflux system)